MWPSTSATSAIGVRRSPTWRPRSATWLRTGGTRPPARTGRPGAGSAAAAGPMLSPCRLLAAVDPELVDEQCQVRVELEVPYPGGGHDQVLGAVKRNPRCLPDDLAVDPGPQRSRRAGRPLLKPLRLPGLRVDARVAELGSVQVAERARRDERPAAEHREDHVRRRRVVGIPAEPANLRPPPGIACLLDVGGVAEHAQRGPVTQLVEHGYEVPAGGQDRYRSAERAGR